MRCNVRKATVMCSEVSNAFDHPSHVAKVEGVVHDSILEERLRNRWLSYSTRNDQLGDRPFVLY